MAKIKIKKYLKKAEKTRKKIEKLMGGKNPYGTGSSSLQTIKFDSYHPTSNFYGNPISIRKKSKYKYHPSF